MSYVACDCATPPIVKMPKRKLAAERYHTTDTRGTWCCVKDADTEEFLPCVLVTESAQEIADREALQAEDAAVKAKKDKHHGWSEMREYQLLCDELSVNATSYMRLGGVLSFDPTKMPEDHTLRFAVILEVSGGGTASAILYNVTDETTVEQSEVSTDSTSPVRLTADLTTDTEFPDAEKLYELHVKTTAGTATAKRASIEVEE
jgi:hypothetical protein